MLSHQASSWRQLGQRERRGRSTLSPSRGRRWTTTFRNEPTTSPKSAQAAITNSRGGGSKAARLGGSREAKSSRERQSSGAPSGLGRRRQPARKRLEPQALE